MKLQRSDPAVEIETTASGEQVTQTFQKSSYTYIYIRIDTFNLL
jgi:hypothetical protein